MRFFDEDGRIAQVTVSYARIFTAAKKKSEQRSVRSGGQWCYCARCGIGIGVSIIAKDRNLNFTVFNTGAGAADRVHQRRRVVGFARHRA